MPDSISHTAPDSSFFFLKKDTSLQHVDSTTIDFSPFVIIENDSSEALFRQDSLKMVTNRAVEKGYEGILRNFSKPEINVYLFALIICFAIFSVIFRYTQKAIRQSLRYFTPSRTKNSAIYKDQITSIEVWGKLFLIFQGFLILSVVVFFYFLSQLKIHLSPEKYWIYFGTIFMLISVFFVLKYTFYKIVRSLLLDASFDDFIDYWIWLNGFIGIICFFPLAIHISLQQFSNITLILIFTTFFISRIFIYIRILDIFLKNKIGILYFITYLCTIEIAPYFVLYKGAILLLNYVGNTLL